jgi:hypothetical protein
MSKTYLVEELFEEIPGDPENLLFNIPAEICEQLGFKEGDTIHFEVQDQKLIFYKV